MSHPGTDIDCRGLPAPLVVLRLKQALLHLSDHALPAVARLDADCAGETVAAGLRANACDVRLTTDAAAPHPDIAAASPVHVYHV